MKNTKIITAIIFLSLFVLISTGCERDSTSKSNIAPTLEQRISGNHQKFEQQKSKGQIAFIACGVVMVGGILFKLGAIITGLISGRRLGKEIEKNRLQKKELEEDTAYKIECDRYQQYKKERLERENKRR